jgi:hypothetical protein
MAKITIKKLDIMSYAKVSALIGAIMGFFIGIFAAIASSFMGAFSGMTGAPLASGGIAAMGIAAIIVVPIMYGIGAFIGGAIGAFIYNIVAQRIGGIKIET